eukprot:TRINITY_DN1135_c0_g2_i3.p3 TRINITY_DN1135_c0_g2~~TRINITY_DN1135_c0_g2_i3.p3  ORF type:complete len:113 (+),score=8.59 TRINITY_DN1135_c0_g2_i3:427-765(+)
MISILLRKYGLICYSAFNGREAVEMVLARKENPFDLILMDGHMPEMSGVEVTGLLRRHHVGTPIFALTGNAIKQDIKAFLGAGANVVLTKPFHKERFFQELAQIRGLQTNKS